VLIVPLSSGLVEEFYSRLVYRWVQGSLTAMSNVVPFALLDALIAAALLALGLRCFWLLRAGWHHGPVAAIAEGARRVIRVVGVVVIAFVTAWGCNYRRLPLEETVRGESAPRPTVEDLEGAVRQAAAVAATLRRVVIAEPLWDMSQVAAELEKPLNAALARLKLPPLVEPGRPKTSLLLTQWFTWAGVNGMVNPLGLESIVHPDLLPSERPFVLAHEWAHLAGQADEAEASAVGWLACMKGGPALAYSASLYLILEAGGALPGEARSKAFASLDAGVRSDLASIAERMSRRQPQVQRAASRVYDEYLKANRVEDGTASYGRALTLILSPELRRALNAQGPVSGG
jgi:hypothetical protein